ncbi:SRPBCC domain-containing protein [Octadecabacter sp.]|nr:SRPBCC domain-containing protein [Octadecabacter sp.]
MPTDTDTFTFDRALPLPPAKLWGLLTDAKMREIWSAPGDAVLDVVTADTRLGGVDRHRCGPEDAPEFEVETRWYNLDTPQAATFTEVIEAGGMRLGASLVTYALSETATGSNLSVTVAVTSFVGPEMIAEFKGGWTGAIEKLVALSAKSLN